MTGGLRRGAMRAGAGRVGEGLALGARWGAGGGALGWADAVGRARHEGDQVGYEWDRAHHDRDQAQRERVGLNRKRSRVMRWGSKSGERGGSRAGVGSMGREGCRDIRPSVHELYPNVNCSAHEPLTGWRSGVFGVGARRLRNLTAWSCEGAGRASYEAGGSRLCAYRNNICLGSLSNQDIPDLRIYALHTEVLSPHAPPFR